MSLRNKKIAVVIPCFKVRDQISKVIQRIPDYVDHVFIVDDQCPEKTGKYVQENHSDPRITVLQNPVNRGVGGAVCRGYLIATEQEYDIIVKVDGDNQMDPQLIQKLIWPIVTGSADYVKGSRFFTPSGLERMPTIRLLGNTALSFINKIVSGYWNIMDPTNGFTAISLVALKELNLEKISPRYFFESDMLFRLGLIKAKVVDFPMLAKYEDEKSNLQIHRVLVSFPFMYFKRFVKRLVYQYFLRDFNFGSISLIFGTLMFFIGSIYGLSRFITYSYFLKIPAPTGMVVIPSMLIILGVQFIISFLQFDCDSYPKSPILKDEDYQ